MNTIDWTDYFDRNKILDQAHTIIDDIIQSIHLQELSIHTRHKLTIDELALLYRWPIYFSVNTFIERFLRSIYYKERNVAKHYPPVNYTPKYYRSVNGAASAYYNDIKINQKLMHNICLVINGNNNGFRTDKDGLPKCENETISELLPYKKQYNFKSGIRFLKRITLGYYILLLRMFFKSSIIYEDDKWVKNVFKNISMLPQMSYNNYAPDYFSRGKIKECCKKAFEKNMVDYIVEFEQSKKDHLLDLFASWIDHAIPLSVIEGLGERFKYYKKNLRGWNVRKVFSSVGYYYSDNLKVFAILAKRNKAILIAQEHGVNNFVCHFPSPPNITKQLESYKSSHIHYKGLNGIMFVDYNCDWGKGKVSDKWNGVEEKLNTKIINTGSVYLSSMRKWQIKEICQDKITLFYPSGPSRDFMASLDEITPEKMIVHKRNIIKLKKSLLRKYSSLNVLYKPFPGIDFRNDPLLEVFSEELAQDRVKITDKPPTELMPEVDIVLFDMISTGFAEAIQIGIPTLVYSNGFDYNRASQEGKKINDELKLCGIVFYDAESGIKSFEKIITDLPGFQKSSSEPIRHFQEAVAFPVSKKSFLQNMDTKITDANSEV